MIFACTSTTGYCIKSSYTHQKVVQATTTFAVEASYHSCERLA